MSAPKSQGQQIQHTNEKLKQDLVQPKSQTFKAIDANSAKYKDMVFFAQLSAFGIATVFFAFLLLSVSFSPFWAFSIALLASFGLRIGIIALIKALK